LIWLEIYIGLFVAIWGQRLLGGSCRGLSWQPSDLQLSAMTIRPWWPLVRGKDIDWHTMKSSFEWLLSYLKLKTELLHKNKVIHEITEMSVKEDVAVTERSKAPDREQRSKVVGIIPNSPWQQFFNPGLQKNQLGHLSQGNSDLRWP